MTSLADAAQSRSPRESSSRPRLCRRRSEAATALFQPMKLRVVYEAFATFQIPQTLDFSYYYRREAGRFDLLKPEAFRGEAGYLCLEQPLGADASALICYMADLERVLSAMGNRGYRDVHLEAGLIGGRTYLAAYALGRGATGLTFYDDDTTKFFSPHAVGKSPILMAAVGVPRSSVHG